LLYMDVALPRRAPVPSRLTHRISIAIDPAPTGPLQPATTYEIAPTDVVRDTPVQVAPPLRGAGWVDSGGCCPPTSYHRTTVLGINGALHDTQRYAIDFVRLNDQGRLYDGPANQNSSYAYFGDPIHAVADGVVVRLLDGQPNQTPGGFPELPIGEIDGNYVVMDIGGGHFAFYAHFQPGLKVKLGQRVREGQVLGVLGNSGNSDGPHLHFHVMDGPSPLGSNGLPYTFTRFRGQGAVTNVDALPGGAVATIDGTRLAGPFAGVLPSDTQLLAFASTNRPGHG
jgi:Peptidase family M23